MTYTTTHFEPHIIVIANTIITVIVDDVSTGHEIQALLQRGVKTNTGRQLFAINVVVTIIETQGTTQKQMLIQAEATFSAQRIRIPIAIESQRS